jgi:hypothetical protein
MGSDFLIDIRYAQILTITIITMTFSSGMPILYLAALVNMLILYWFDKIWGKKRNSFN